jgi:hypothetical protein
MIRLNIMTAAGLVATFCGFATLIEGRDTQANHLICIAGVVFLAAGLAGKGVVAALKNDRNE